MTDFSIKDWQDRPAATTPLDAAALKDMEQRLSDHANTAALEAALGVKPPVADTAALGGASRWTGPHVTDAIYLPGDVVTHGGALYVCVNRTRTAPGAAYAGITVAAGANHPTAPAQSTAYGRAISELAVTPDRTRIVAGYGDWDANTGPMTMASVTLADAAGAWTTEAAAAVASEAVYTIRRLSDGRMVAVHIDGRGYGQYTAGYATRNAAGVWTDRPDATAHPLGRVIDHVWDYVEFNGSHYLLAAGRVSTLQSDPAKITALVFRSDDAGATWDLDFERTYVGEPLVAPLSAGQQFGSCRAWFFAIADGRLWIRPQATRGTLLNAQGTAVSWEWDEVTGVACSTDGGVWETGTADEVLPRWIMGGPGKAWGAGWIIPRSMFRGLTKNTGLWYFDGSSYRTIAGDLGGVGEVMGWDVATDGALYVITRGRRIYRCKEPARLVAHYEPDSGGASTLVATWEYIGAPAAATVVTGSPTSLAVIDAVAGTFAVGTTASRVELLTAPAAPAWERMI